MRVAILSILCAVAYRGLLKFDPYAGVRGRPEIADDLFFLPGVSHPGLVVGLAACLLWVRVRNVDEAHAGRMGSALAVFALALAGGLSVWGHLASSGYSQILSLCLLIPGLALWLAGPVAARAVALPAAMLLLAAPPPAVVVNAIVFPLQLATTRFAAWILAALGRTPFVQGDTLRDGGNLFQVIETCSGYRSIETMILATLLYVGLTRRNAWVTTILLLAAPVIGFVANGIRVVSLVWFPSSPLQDVHTLQGLLMFSGGLALLLGLDRLLVGFWKSRRVPSPAPVSPRSEPKRALRWGAATALVGILAGLSLLPLSTVWPAEPTPARIPLRFFPVSLGGWEGRGLGVDRDFLGNTRFSEWIHRRYQRGDEPVIDVFLVADERRFLHTNVLSPKIVVPGRGFDLMALGREPVESLGGSVDLYRASRGNEEALVFYGSQNLGSLLNEAVDALFTAGLGPGEERSRSVAFRLMTPLEKGPAGRVEAVGRVRDFVPYLSSALRALDQPVPLWEP
ncbi:exosortase-associated EpsI family protein [Myxococcota bacterium]|nr:exosortase-associated EpsI family protein [Myxococcota bacterium]